MLYVDGCGIVDDAHKALAVKLDARITCILYDMEEVLKLHKVSGVDFMSFVRTITTSSAVQQSMYNVYVKGYLK